ncbi:hypothetical protein ACEZDB_09870 [Streptacidiphilus sp. N1-3]|uniref:Uncharacterized protein n=1 Tax=Streptacidiphilus alkalitolerans TaxID=3342712 RepID=A0ABV6WY51_9ACTN
MAAVPLYLTWRQRYDSDRAHGWLRDQAREALRAVCRAPGAGPGRTVQPV